ncbi:hypothetical protein I8752_25400 [Nostocaceae cyanobacterium CENA369]|uniref:Uncharacterized protein n=1 Tax=Dendronalium phyllosphericum CENA369 TaxID=1725256 RepID=A0A8J7IDX7_9NOST|nr:hypothetical protein [Dendronalium phyllosphericum]MBH8576267.1 hypothetical protein [Dendronalium phyllosphericum CENA369]
MSDRIITSNLLVALSTEQQQLLAGGRNFSVGNRGFGDNNDEGDFGGFGEDEGDSDESDLGNNTRNIRLRSGSLRLGGGDNFSGGGFSDRRGITFLKLTFFSR